MPVRAPAREREQHEIDAVRFETEGLRAFLAELAAALVQPAIDEKTLAGVFDQMARTGNASVGAVELDFHSALLGRRDGIVFR